MNTDSHGFRSASLGLCVSLPLFLLLAACAESDPYKRIEPTHASNMDTGSIVREFDNRWPMQFKSVQSVTIDFGPVTKTFNALLVIQRPGKFRLQGMTEQGIKIFDLAYHEGSDHVIFKADEMSEQTIGSISRDIRRVFLNSFEGVPTCTHDEFYFCLEGNTPRLTSRALLTGGNGSGNYFHSGTGAVSRQMCNVAWVDRAEVNSQEGQLYCFSNYDWVEQPHDSVTELRAFYPSVIVLRDSGRESKSYPYKLTIKITELTVRDTPWPEKTFKP